MASQNNPGRQFDKQHAVTIVATAIIEKYRFVGYNGQHATSAGGVNDSQGTSEYGAAAGDAFSAITSYSGLVEVAAGQTIAFGDPVKPAADGSGKAALGDSDDNCGRALGAGTEGHIIEVQIQRHVHPATP